MEFEAKSSAHRFCTTKCRKRGNRAPGKAKAKPRRRTEAVTEAELERLGKVETPEGQLALVLAHQIDQAGESGQTLAAMSKQLAALMTALRSGSKAKADPVDELAARRRRRLAGA